MEIKILKNVIKKRTLFHGRVGLKYKDLKILFGKPTLFNLGGNKRVGWVIEFKGYEAFIYFGRSCNYNIAYPIEYIMEDDIKKIHGWFKEEIENRKFSIWFVRFNKED